MASIFVDAFITSWPIVSGMIFFIEFIESKGDINKSINSVH